MSSRTRLLVLMCGVAGGDDRCFCCTGCAANFASVGTQLKEKWASVSPPVAREHNEPQSSTKGDKTSIPMFGGAPRGLPRPVCSLSRPWYRSQPKNKYHMISYIQQRRAPSLRLSLLTKKPSLDWTPTSSSPRPSIPEIYHDTTSPPRALFMQELR